MLSKLKAQDGTIDPIRSSQQAKESRPCLAWRHHISVHDNGNKRTVPKDNRPIVLASEVVLEGCGELCAGGGALEGRGKRSEIFSIYFFKFVQISYEKNSKKFFEGEGHFFSKSYFLMIRISIGSFFDFGHFRNFRSKFFHTFPHCRISLKIGPMTKYGRLISKIIISRIHREGEGCS